MEAFDLHCIALQVVTLRCVAEFFTRCLINYIRACITLHCFALPIAGNRVLAWSTDTLCTKKYRLYFICFAIGSHCYSSRAGVIWSHGLMSRTVCTATCTAGLCNGTSVDTGRPTIIALQWSRCDSMTAVTSLVLTSWPSWRWTECRQCRWQSTSVICVRCVKVLLGQLDDIVTRLSLLMVDVAEMPDQSKATHLDCIEL